MEFLSKHSAEIIALCAVIFTAWQAFIQRKHNRISLKPHLFRYVNRDKHNEIGRLQFVITNNGLGPAYIKKFQIYLHEKEVNAKEAIESVLGNLVCDSSYTILGNDYAMPHNESKVVLSVSFNAKSWEEIYEVEKKLNVLDLHLIYTSAYGEKFELDTRENS